MGRKRLKVSGYIEIPDGAALPELGSKVAGKWEGEVTGDGEELKRRQNGDVEIIATNKVTLASDYTTLEKVEAPAGDLDEALAGVGAE